MRTLFGAPTLCALAMLAFLITAVPGAAQSAQPPYPKMAPIAQYLMPDRNAEIALARSAAPDAISRDATILVFGRHGFETAVTGKNGFVCFVDRAWTSTLDFAEVWNPKIRGAECLNPPAVRSILPITYLITKSVLAGESRPEVVADIDAAYREKRLPTLQLGALSYMMSKGSYLTDSDGHNFAHVMFFAPGADGRPWGADLPKSPFASMSYWFPNVADEQLGKELPSIRIFMIATRHWSDGTRQQ